MKYKTLPNYYGLEYVKVLLPVKKLGDEEIIDSDLDLIDRRVSLFILEKGVPLRGIEVAFLRKTLGLSYRAFAEVLGLSAPAILKWEKAKHTRLAPINEVAVRSYFAQKLDLNLAGKFDVLKGRDNPPKEVQIKAPRRAA